MDIAIKKKILDRFASFLSKLCPVRLAFASIDEKAVTDKIRTRYPKLAGFVFDVKKCGVLLAQMPYVVIYMGKGGNRRLPIL